MIHDALVALLQVLVLLTAAAMIGVVIVFGFIAAVPVVRWLGVHPGVFGIIVWTLVILGLWWIAFQERRRARSHD